MGHINRMAVRLSNKLHPHGNNICRDITRGLPNVCIHTVFDVGANVGQTTREFARWFPDAQFYCFEPEERNFGELQNNTTRLKHVHLFKTALGNIKGKGSLMLSDDHTMHRIGHTYSDGIDVDIETIDGICEKYGVGEIDILKIDTEGYDLKVVEGALDMLTEQKISIIYTEAGVSAHNDRHVPLWKLSNYLLSLNYHIFGIYEQVNEWPTRRPELRRVNAAFISEGCAASNQA
jgi:FkbM family methyltransferase